MEQFSGSELAAIQHDVIETVQELRDRKLVVIERAAGAATFPAVAPISAMDEELTDSDAPVPSLMFCLLALVAVSMSLRVLGLRRILRLIPRSRTRSRMKSAWADGITHRLRGAAAILPFRAACLEQSLCLLWLMRRVGATAELRLGFAPYPFTAHAWVEANGIPVNERPEELARYRAFPPFDLATL